MLRVLVYAGIVFFCLWMIVSYMRHLSKPYKTIYDEPEYKRYFIRVMKQLIKEVNEEDEFKTIKEACWYCEHVVVDVYGDGSHHCKIKNGQWVPADSTCDDFKPKEVRSEGGQE